MMDAEDKVAVEHLEKAMDSEDNQRTPTECNKAAKAAFQDESQMTLIQALRKYKRAVFWSAFVSLAIIMEGYDIVLVTSLFAQPAFSQKFGQEIDGTYTISGSWQAALGSAPIIGAVFGAFANGALTARLGYRRVLLGSLILIIGFIFILFFAETLSVLFAGLILCGIPWGVFATTAPAYASEVCPLVLRPYLTVYVNLCWALGQLIAAGVLAGFANGTEQWAYRIPFGIQWAWPVPLLALLAFAPESPWWLVYAGQDDRARRALRKLAKITDEEELEAQIAMMKHTHELEQEASSGTRYIDCFRGIDLRRTEIACLAFAAQVWCGSPMGGTPAYFFVQAGLSPSTSFQFSVGGLGLASVGTILAWFLMAYFGRRSLYTVGLGLLSVLMLVIGIISAASTPSGTGYATASVALLWLLTYYLTVGPVCYAIISEVSAVRLRAKSVCLSRIAYYISQAIGNVIQPYMINPSEGNWHGKTGFFWAGTAFVFFLWSYFRLPETRARTFEELDVLFQHKVGSREFEKFKVDPYAENEARLKRE